MPSQTVHSRVCINHPSGFHLRLITAFAVRARGFQSLVTVIRNDHRVDGKSPFEMMSLVSPQGTELLLEVSGPDAPEALQALADLVQNRIFRDDDEGPLAPEG